MRLKNKIIAFTYLVLIIIAAIWLGQSLFSSKIIQTNLSSLLPYDKQTSYLLQKAQDQNNQIMNQNMMILIGSPQLETSVQAAEKITNSLKKSKLFKQVNLKVAPDLDIMFQELEQLNLALLPQETIKLIQDQPQLFFENRAQDIINPFSEYNIFPLSQDPLGFSAMNVAKLSSYSKNIQWDSISNTLTIHDHNKVWIVINAQFPEQSIFNTPEALLPTIKQTQDLAKQLQVDILFSSGALFAAENKQAGEKEGLMMSITGVLLTLFFLLFVFKSPKIILLLSTPLVGILFGLCASILLFSEIHILTLVIGTSLIGLLIDFPLHWVAKGTRSGWQAQKTILPTARIFLISLIITVIGYLMLLATNLKVLQQTAVFSVVSLIAAYFYTLFILPLLMANFVPQINPLFLKFCLFIHRVNKALRHYCSYPIIMIIALGMTLISLYLSNWQDDIKQWVKLSDHWIKENQAIAQLTGIQPSGQYFLIQAQTEDELLDRDYLLTQKLQHAQQEGTLNTFFSLGTLLNNAKKQNQIQENLKYILKHPDIWSTLTQIGVPDHIISDYLHKTSLMKTVNIEHALNSSLTKQWHNLWLGTDSQQQYFASMILLSGVHNTSALEKLANQTNGIFFVDQVHHLNQLFHDVQIQTIFLKLASYVFAILVLIYIFGYKLGLKILSVPLASAISTVIVFSYLGLPITLFTTFGLLLVSAIGLDYAVYSADRHMEFNEKIVGILLSAVTTMISFSLLSFSSTPAVADFGLSVAIGVIFSVIFTSWITLNNNKT